MDEVIVQFTQLVRQRLKTHLKQMILFGSRARGDFTETSDYDVLIVVDKRNRDIQEVVLDASVEMLDKYSALIGSIVCDETEWQSKQHFPIGLNIAKEGVAL